MLGYKASLSIHKKVEITLCILSDHNGTKLELNSKRNCRKYSNTWRLNDTLLNDKLVTEKIRGDTRKFLVCNENENTTFQNLWDTKKAVLGRKFIAISIYIKQTQNLK
jgi:hypothetical protein